MITPHGYSKDPGIIPEGIMITLPAAFFDDRKCSIEHFKKLFERYMRRDDAIWNFPLTNLPTHHNIAWVYLIFDKQVQFRCNFVQYERNETKVVLFTGPAIKPPHQWPQKGFRGFRYTTKLF
jgi:hypothetical protein